MTNRQKVKKIASEECGVGNGKRVEESKMRRIERFFDILHDKGLLCKFIGDVYEWKYSSSNDSLVDNFETLIPLESYKDYLKEVKMYKGITTINRSIYNSNKLTSWTTSKDIALKFTNESVNIDTLLLDDIPMNIEFLEDEGTKSELDSYLKTIEIKGLVLKKEQEGLMIDVLIKELYQYLTNEVLSNLENGSSYDDYNTVIDSLKDIVDSFPEEEVLSPIDIKNDSIKIVEERVVLTNNQILKNLDFWNNGHNEQFKNVC